MRWPSPLAFAVGVWSLAVWSVVGRASGQEFRGLWVDAFHSGLRTPAEVSAVVAAARAKNVNAVFAQVRKRGDAYYRGGLEPVAAEVAPDFDPLADLIAKAHDTGGGGARLEVHAWLVTYNIWNRETAEPVQPDHPFRRFPDWVSQKYRASTGDPVVRWDGGNYPFDQGHPAVQQHTFDVAMDIVRRYNVDGLHFDYIRYSDDSSSGSQPWGYHPASVARFNTLKKRTGTPLPGDSQWLQWRRDQVTALLRKVYLHTLAEKPRVRVSAALVCYDPAPSLTATSWAATPAYTRVLQDWRGWLEEGILDLGCPMAYKTSNASFSGWTSFIRERQYNRASALGLGWYMNPVEQTIEQVKIARSASPGGRRAAGVLGYSYAVTNNAAVPAPTFQRALTDEATAELFDPGGSPVFADPAAPPGMPWKSDPARAHLMGTLRTEGDTQTAVDGALVTLSGPVIRSLTSDGTGFYGAVDLPTGRYTVTVSRPGLGTQVRTVDLQGAAVAETAFFLRPPALEILSHSWDPVTRRLQLTWSSEPGQVFSVEFSSDLETWTLLAGGVPSGGVTTSYQTPSLPAGATERFWRVRGE
jgi:uncharacterized lipoprotein YddW (UPF0748 family)